MKSKKITQILIFLLLITFFPINNVNAQNFYTLPSKTEINLNNIPKTTQINDTLNLNGYYQEVSPVYEFFDENNNYNIVYEATNNEIHWLKLSDNYQILSNINLEMSAPLFGNAIYDNGYLYIVYGREGDTYNSITIEITKYDTNGKIINNLELLGSETSNVSSTSSYGTWIPFSYANPGNCSLAMRDDILVVYFSRLMFNAHQSSCMLVVDTNTMRLKTDGIWKAFQYYFGTSHSFDQRVIVSSDNNIVTIDSGDANATRGFYLEKTEFIDTNSAYIRKYVPFHFREGSDTPYGYNNTYATMGNIIEVSDGYIYVGASEKTLSLEYSDNNYNEPWNLFVQKYKSDFETETDVTNIHILNENIRLAEGIKPEVNYGKLFLNANTKDYGVKWLTDYQTDVTIDIVRAINIENDEILIMYEKTPILKEKGENAIADNDNSEIYYIIIDKDANIIQQPVKIYDVKMSKEINYLYQDGFIIWATATGKEEKLTINKLDIDNVEISDEIPITKIEAKGYNNQIIAGGATNFTIAYYPTNTTEEKQVTYSSDNNNVATVSSSGKITTHNGGIATITATTKNGVSTSFKIYVSQIKLNVEKLIMKPNETYQLNIDKVVVLGEEINTNTLKWTSSNNNIVTVDNNGKLKAISNGTSTIKVSTTSNPYVSTSITVDVKDYLKGDINLDDKITITDVIKLLRIYLELDQASENSLEIGDMNDDNKITITDVIILLRTYLNIN
mgnify:FL=1